MATAFNLVLLEKLAGAGWTVEQSRTFSGSSVTPMVDEDVATAQTDYEIVVAVDVSAIQCIMIVSTEDVTLETNDGTTPDDTISLTADVPYIWDTDSYFVNLLTVDITSVFITNASGATANIKMFGVTDATP